MPIYEATVTMTYSTETFINRFNYRAVSQPDPQASAADLAFGLGWNNPDPSEPTEFNVGTVLRGIQALSTTELKFISLTVFNLYDPADFIIGALTPFEGNIAPPTEPPFTSVGFKGLRTNRSVRDAQKRFGGFPRAFTDGGGFINPTGLVVTTDVENILGSDVVGNDTTYRFVTLSKKKVDEVVDGRTVRKYVKWDTEAEALENSYPVSEWQVYGRLRTQTSRQYFRGQ